MLKKTLILLGLLATSLLANAHEYNLGPLHIEHPWSRAMPPVAPTAAVYFVVRNSGQQADRLLSDRRRWPARPNCTSTCTPMA